MTTSQSVPYRRLPAALFFAIPVFWTALWAAGYPPPNWDDLFFAGGAFELAGTGRLANPLIRFWNPVAANRYFFQPPFYQYALAGWLRLFGISAHSVLGFQCLVLAVCSLCAALLLRRYGFSGASIVPVLLAFSMAPQGLRHDAMGLALLAAGLWFLSFPGVLRALLGAFLLASALATWPALLAYAAPFGGVVSMAGLQPGSPRKIQIARRLVVFLAGAGAAFLLFLASIRFRLHEFLADFTWHARLRRPTLGGLLPAIKLQLTNGSAGFLYGPLYAVFLLLTIVTALRWKQTRVEARVFLCTVWVGILANLVLYASILHTLADLFCWIGVVILLWEIPVRPALRRIAVAAAIVAFAIAQSYLFIAAAGRKSVPEAEYRAAREALRNHPSGLVAADEVAARLVFDYRLPAGAFFWNYSVPPPQTWPFSIREKAPGVMWVLSPVKSGVTQGIPATEKVRFLGRVFGSISARPQEIVVIE